MKNSLKLALALASLTLIGAGCAASNDGYVSPPGAVVAPIDQNADSMMKEESATDTMMKDQNATGTMMDDESATESRMEGDGVKTGTMIKGDDEGAGTSDGSPDMMR